MEELGARASTTPQEAVAGMSWVITMLADGRTSKSLWDDGRLALNIQDGATVIEMGSRQPAETKAIAEVLPEGCNYIDAPVSGGTKGAEAGTLAIMAGGEAFTITAANELFSALGRVVRVRPAGAGQVAKLYNQAIVAVTIGAVSEAILLMTAGGADPEQLPCPSSEFLEQSTA